MAVSETLTHKLLNVWPGYMQVNPWHFNQISGPGAYAPLAEPGDIVYVQPDRDNIAEGLNAAIALAVPYLKTFHRPVYVSETIPFTSGWPGHYGASVKARYRHIQAVGVRGNTVIEAAAPVVFSDDGSGGGVDNLATVTVTLPAGVTDPTEVRVFFKQSDSLSVIEADDRFEIEPLKVSISGTTATITGPRWLFVNPALWREPFREPNYNRSSINNGVTTNPADFVTEVDVYRIYPDATGAVTYHTTPAPNCSDCSYTDVAGTGYVKHSELGLLQLCSDCVGWPCVGYVRTVTVHYLAGIPLDPLTLRPDRNIERAFIRLGNAKLPTVPADNTIGASSRWLSDFMTYPSGELPPNLLNNPFGVKVGEVEAFRALDPYAPFGGGALMVGGW